jgi:hypothetical protein
MADSGGGAVAGAPAPLAGDAKWLGTARGGASAGPTRPVGQRREGRAPVSAFVIGQEVLAWHRSNGWQPAVVMAVREDGKYVLNWLNGDESDRIKTRTNLRKGIKDQLKQSAKSTSAPLGSVENREEVAGVATVGVTAIATVAGGEVGAAGAAKVGTNEVVITGGDAYSGATVSGELGPTAVSTVQATVVDPAVNVGGIKTDTDTAGSGAGTPSGKQGKKRAAESEDDGGAGSGGRGAVPPPLSAGGWEKSDHQGLMTMWFQNKRC